MKIKEHHPNVQFFVPLRNKQWFLDCGIHSVTELDWWEERDILLSSSSSSRSQKDKLDVVPVDDQHQTAGASSNMDITARIGCLPCQHTSARGPFDRGHTLWASWSVESGGKKVWFGGYGRLISISFSASTNDESRDTGYRAVPELPKNTDDYGPEHNYPHCPAFKQIGDLRGPFDLGLIPIGAYDPRW